MKAEAQKIAIAKSVGWEPCHKGCEGKTWRYPDDSGCTETLPDYLNDLNAMHEVVATLDDLQKFEYIYCLMNIVCPDPYGVGNLYESSYKLTRATAAQQAKAYLKTINKWK